MRVGGAKANINVLACRSAQSMTVATGTPHETHGKRGKGAEGCMMGMEALYVSRGISGYGHSGVSLCCLLA